MYKAIHVQTGEEIIILNPHWRKRIELLRAMDRADELVCQGCRQPLRVKAGEVKRPHFAHKHLQACSYGSESPEILNARAVLYEWLLRQFRERAVTPVTSVTPVAPVTSVTVEKQVEGFHLPRPVDCWVETAAGCFAWWIIEAGIKLEPREAIRAAFEQMGVKIHYFFLQPMLNEERKEFHSLLLTPTERAFMQSTEYDALLAGPAEPGTSLHYLDADRSILTTYRNLGLFHRPNWYKGVKKVTPLAQVRASPANGEFVHPGEEQRLSLRRQKQNRLEEKRKRYQQREADWASRLSACGLDAPRSQTASGGQTVSRGQPASPKPAAPGAGWGAGQPEKDESETQGISFAEPLPCVICGQVTTDYWSTFTDSNGCRLCRCRECLDREGGQAAA